MKIEEAIAILENSGWWGVFIPITTIEGRSDEDKLHQAIDMAISVLRSTQQPGKPLTLEQLREMDGQPVWCEDVERWALVSVSDAGKWKGVPFALFEKNDARFEWNIEGRELSLYSYPPAHIDRSKWEACDHCKKACWNCNHNLFAVKEMTKCDDCVNQSKWEFLAYQNYCPKCGRPLTEEAWVELERRLMG